MPEVMSPNVGLNGHCQSPIDAGDQWTVNDRFLVRKGGIRGSDGQVAVPQRNTSGYGYHGKSQYEA